MPLREIREERKRLGSGVKKGPRTLTLVLLLIFVVFLMFALGRGA